MGHLQEELRAALAERRVVIMGVGNPLRGDDGFGPLVVEGLRGQVSCPLLDCGSAPENFAGKVRALGPEVVLVIDAAEFGGRPGELRLVGGGAAGASGLSTHAAGLDMLLAYLERACAATGWLLAVQPVRLGLGNELSPEARAAAAEAVEALVEALAEDA